MANPGTPQHAVLSFSSRERWRKCPVSVHMSQGMPDSSGVAASEGTAAHSVAEFYVRKHFDLPGLHRMPDGPQEAPDQEVPAGLDLKGKTAAEWNEELRMHGRAYVAWIISIIPPGEEHYASVEQKVSIKSISDKLWGTGDLFIWFPRLKIMLVIDYKYGFASVDVGTVENTNPQLSAYAVASLDGKSLHADGGYVLAVYQPRRPMGDVAQTLVLPPDWEAKERAKLRNEVAAVENPGAPRPGDHCRYCKGKSKCPATQNALAAAIQAHCGEVDMLSLPADQLIALYAARTAFKAFWEDVEERIAGLAKEGHAKLTIKESQGRQMWADPKLAALTFLSMGRTDLLQPVALSEALPHLPEAYREGLVKRTANSKSIKVVDNYSPHAIAGIFQKYVKKVDTQAQ